MTRTSTKSRTAMDYFSLPISTKSKKKKQQKHAVQIKLKERRPTICVIYGAAVSSSNDAPGPTDIILEYGIFLDGITLGSPKMTKC